MVRSFPKWRSISARQVPAACATLLTVAAALAAALWPKLSSGGTSLVQCGFAAIALALVHTIALRLWGARAALFGTVAAALWPGAATSLSTVAAIAWLAAIAIGVSHWRGRLMVAAACAAIGLLSTSAPTAVAVSGAVSLALVIAPLHRRCLLSTDELLQPAALVALGALVCAWLAVVSGLVAWFGVPEASASSSTSLDGSVACAAILIVFARLAWQRVGEHDDAIASARRYFVSAWSVSLAAWTLFAAPSGVAAITFPTAPLVAIAVVGWIDHESRRRWNAPARAPFALWALLALEIAALAIGFARDRAQPRVPARAETSSAPRHER